MPDLSRWREYFKNFVIKTVDLPITNKVLTYLKDNGTMILPEYGEVIWSSDSEDYDDLDNTKQVDFTDFDQEIKRCIKEVGGSAFIKVNSKAPTDASWAMSTSNAPLEVTEPLLVWQLLKSSDRIQPCLEHCSPTLHFQSFIPIITGTEYRCFIQNNRLQAISQRDIHAHYPYTIENLDANSKSLTLFISENVIPVLSDYFEETELILDVYKTGNGDWKILDIDILAPETNCLLFDYNLDLKINIRPLKLPKISGVTQKKIYDWSGYCGLMRVRSLGNFSANNLSISRMSTDNQNLLSGSLKPSDLISAMQH